MLISMKFGAPAVSGKREVTSLAADETFTRAESISVPSANSRKITDTLSELWEEMFETPLTVDRESSSTSVTSDSTFSALAPGSVVMTAKYGMSISGSRSVFILLTETPPRIRAMMTATTMT